MILFAPSVSSCWGIFLESLLVRERRDGLTAVLGQELGWQLGSSDGLWFGPEEL